MITNGEADVLLFKALMAVKSEGISEQTAEGFLLRLQHYDDHWSIFVREEGKEASATVRRGDSSVEMHLCSSLQPDQARVLEILLACFLTIAKFCGNGGGKLRTALFVWYTDTVVHELMTEISQKMGLPSGGFGPELMMIIEYHELFGIIWPWGQK